MSASQQFTCKCKKNNGWIAENQVTSPCPNCGRQYQGKYNKKKHQIDAIEYKGILND